MENAPNNSRSIRFGSYELDLRAGELRKQGVKIKLQEQPLQLLAMLLANPGQVVTREELRTRLWPADTFVDFAPPGFGSYTVNVKALDAAGNWGAVATFFYIYVKAVPSVSSFTPRGNVFNPKLGQSMTLNYALDVAIEFK